MNNKNKKLKTKHISIHPTTKLYNDLEIPIIGLGTCKINSKDTINIVYNAIKNGYRHIDTAFVYKNESEVGEGIRKAMNDFNIDRKELFITSKYPTTKKININDAKNDIIRTVQNTITDMGIDYLDLYLLHSPHHENVRLLRWEGLEECVNNNLLKSIGISNYNKQHIEELLKVCKIKPVINQIEVHPFFQRNDLCQFCFKNKILIEAYSPLVKGKKFDNDILIKIAKTKKNASVAQIMLRWNLQKGNIILPKTINEKRLIENADLFRESLELTEKEMEEIEELDEDYIAGWYRNID